MGYIGAFSMLSKAGTNLTTTKPGTVSWGLPGKVSSGSWFATTAAALAAKAAAAVQPAPSRVAAPVPSEPVPTSTTPIVLAPPPNPVVQAADIKAANVAAGYAPVMLQDQNLAPVNVTAEPQAQDPTSNISPFVFIAAALGVWLLTRKGR